MLGFDSISFVQLLSLLSMFVGLPMFTWLGWDPLLWYGFVSVFNVGLGLGAVLGSYEIYRKSQVPPRSP